LTLFLVFSWASGAEPIPTQVPALAPLNLTPRQLTGQDPPPRLEVDPQSGKAALPEVIQAFKQLRSEALQAGWHLVLVSGYRSFTAQKNLWNSLYDDQGKESAEEKSIDMLHYTSLPGLSRHHWGSELDISEKSLRGLLLAESDDPSPKVMDYYRWMEFNAPRYGFCRVYRGQSGIINDEHWHWSYYPLAVGLQKQFQALGDLSSLLPLEGVKGEPYLKTHLVQIQLWQAQSVDLGCIPKN
jgi:LAS superfamily LD-carboxypeptidase LdcB